jgi:hypothetical protein
MPTRARLAQQSGGQFHGSIESLEEKTRPFVFDVND